MHMSTPTAIPLWTGTPPGTFRDAMRDDPRAREAPVVKPFLLPATDTLARPLVVVCPGGGYSHRAPHEGDPLAVWLNGLGIHALVCHYRVFPWLYPSALLDVQRTVRLARANAAVWGVDPERIGVLGFSAGGHLAACAATFGDAGEAGADDPVARLSSRVNALVACYPVISNGPKGHAGSFQNLLGDHPDPEMWRRLSLERSVTPDHPPTFIWHTANDAGVPVENALLYASALAEAGVSFALHVYPDGPHGLGLAVDRPGSVRTWPQACASWFGELGWICSNSQFGGLRP